MEFLAHKEHKIQKLLLRGVLQKWKFDKNLLRRVAYLEIWSKSLKKHLKYLVFGSFLAVCLHVYSRANSCTTVFSCFSTVTEQLKFLKLLQVVDSASVIFVRRCSSNVIQPISRELQSQWWTPMPKCNFNKVALQLYWNYTSAWLFSYKFPAYFKNPFS